MMAGLLAAAKGWSIWSVMRDYGARVVRWLFADFWRALALAALIACAVLMVRIDGLHISFSPGSFQFSFINIEGLKDRAKRAEASLQAMKDEQSRAAAAQAAVNHEPAQISRAIAKASDVQSKTYYEQGRAAAAGYAAGNGVRNACPEDRADGAGLPRTGDIAAQHDGPGETADMVAVTRADFDQLTGNSLRLAQVREDAQALIASGVAIALEGEPLSVMPETPL